MRSAAFAALAAAIVLAALALAGCGGDGRPHDRAAFGSGPNQAPPIRTFTCGDWKRADHETQRSTVLKIRAFAGGEITGQGVGTGAHGPTLDDRMAFTLFDRTCRQQAARYFLLYKLYTHAAAFAGHS